jgi:hypothetical protein
MKFFLKRLAGGRRSFRGLGMGETAALGLLKGMRRGQVSPVNKPLKKQAREPWSERKGFMACAHSNPEGFLGCVTVWHYPVGTHNRIHENRESCLSFTFFSPISVLALFTKSSLIDLKKGEIGSAKDLPNRFLFFT